MCECYNCEHRQIGCHDNCEAYKAFKQYRADLKEKERAERSTIWWTPQKQNKIYKSKRVKNSQSRRER